VYEEIGDEEERRVFRVVLIIRLGRQCEASKSVSIYGCKGERERERQERLPIIDEEYKLRRLDRGRREELQI
jgi:hypothetical protein